MPLQGPSYSGKEPLQGLLAAVVLVELERVPDERAGTLLAMGDAGRKVDQAAGREQVKCLDGELVAVVHGG